MKFSLLLAPIAALAMVFSLCAPVLAAAEEQGVIQVVSAFYGPANSTRPLNFISRLQQICGGSASYCEAYCSNAFVGRGPRGLRLPFGPASVCRVTYRCGAAATLVTDAEKNDLIVLSCRQRP